MSSSSLRTVTKNSRRPILQNSGTFVVIVFSLFRLNGLSEFSKMGDDNNEIRAPKICFKIPAKKNCVSCVSLLEGDTGGKHLLDEWRRRNEILQLEVEDPLEPLDAERPQGRESVQDPGEILLALLLRVRIVGHVIFERADDAALKTFDLLWFLETVTF